MNGVLAYNGYENKCQSEWLFLWREPPSITRERKYSQVWS